MQAGRFSTAVLAGMLLLGGCSAPGNGPMGNGNGNDNGNGNTNGNANDNGIDNDLSAFTVTSDFNFQSAARAGASEGTQEVPICGGFFPAQPNHQLVVNDSQNITVSAAGQNVLLWVTCGESDFCGETVNNAEEIIRFWNRGDCNVYIGAPVAGIPVEYTLTFTRS